MYYALIDSRSDVYAETSLLWGDLQDIASGLIEQCDTLIESMDDMSMEELEDEYYCEFDSYRELSEKEDVEYDDIYNFSFVLSDLTIEIGCLVESYDELVSAFEEYTEDKITLDEWKLVSEFDETEENLAELDKEIRSLNDDLGERLFPDGYKFIIRKDEEDFDDWEDDEDE